MDAKERHKIAYKKWAEKNKAYLKEKRRKYREEHKDELNENARIYRNENKNITQKNWSDWYEKNKEYNSKRQREWRKTEAGHKNFTFNNWRDKGVIGDYDVIYKKYMTTSNCEVCKKEFTDKIKKYLDHDHTTGEFRYILCASCNNHDFWKKVIISHTDTP